MFENLIAVCYCGGSRGNAVAHVIGFSPEVHRPWSTAGVAANIDANGAVSIFSRLRDRRCDLPHDVVSVHDRLGLGMYHRDQPLPGTVVAAYSDAYQHLVLDADGMRLCEVPPDRRAIFADHADPLHNLQLYPGSMAVAVRCDWAKALRNFKIKWLDSPSFEDASTTNMDAEVRMDGMLPCRHGRKSRLRSHARQLMLANLGHDAADGMVVVDSDRLLSIGKAADEYHRMVAYLGLTPAWDQAKPWIDEYVRREWHR